MELAAAVVLGLVLGPFVWAGYKALRAQMSERVGEHATELPTVNLEHDDGPDTVSTGPAKL